MLSNPAIYRSRFLKCFCCKLPDFSSLAKPISTSSRGREFKLQLGPEPRELKLDLPATVCRAYFLYASKINFPKIAKTTEIKIGRINFVPRFTTIAAPILAPTSWPMPSRIPAQTEYLGSKEKIRANSNCCRNSSPSYNPWLSSG